MDITITIKDKAIKDAIAYFLDNEIFDMFDPSVIKAAGAPKKAALVKEIFEDPKFIARLTAHVRECVVDDIEGDVLYHAVGREFSIEQADALIDKLDKVQEELRKMEAQNREEAETQRIVDKLIKAGYKIQKP